jgi:hypothetical protein
VCHAVSMRGRQGDADVFLLDEAVGHGTLSAPWESARHSGRDSGVDASPGGRAVSMAVR